MMTELERVEDLEAAEAGVRALLRLIDPDPDRDGLKRTPERVVAAMLDYAARGDEEVATLLAVQFEERHDEVILVGPIDFVSLCEHHLLPFTGHGFIAYIPGNGRIVGLSKLPRLLDHYAARPQVQERLTSQIADAIDQHLEPRGVAVVITAAHTCMTLRGAHKPDAAMTTSVTRGLFREDERARAELMSLIRTSRERR